MTTLLHIKNLQYQIGDRQILSIHDLKINTGEIIHLIGRSGVGKSLFGQSLIGVFSSDGIIDYDFHYAFNDQLDWQLIRQKCVGYIYQQPLSYFNPLRTIADHFNECKDVNSLLSDFKIGDYFERFDLPPYNLVHKRFPSELSVGQLQRIYTIMIMVRRPQLIIADEPFAHLDQRSSSLIANELVHFVNENNASLLIISHETPNELIRADRIWHLENGAIDEMPHVDNQPKVSSDLRTRKADSLTGISLENIRYSYPVITKGQTTAQPILQNVNMKISKGDHIAIMGTSGSGKSTLAKILAGYILPTSGRMKGIFSSPFSLTTWFHRPASPQQLVAQDPFESFAANLTLGQQIGADVRRRMEAYLETMHLHEDIWNQRPSTLSGGELQRVALARALGAGDHLSMIILDESLSALDHENLLQVKSILQNLNEELIIVIIAHRVHHITDICNQIFKLEEGKLVVVDRA